MAWAFWDSCGRMRRTEGSVEDMAEKYAVQRIVCQGERCVDRVFSRRRYSSVGIVTSWDVGPPSGDPRRLGMLSRQGALHSARKMQCREAEKDAQNSEATARSFRRAKRRFRPNQITIRFTTWAAAGGGSFVNFGV
jgi:hypothetical protein